MSSSLLAGDAAVVGDAEQAVFVQLEAEADGAIAQRDVVRLRAGEVLHRGAAAVGRDQPQIGLEAALQQDARLGVAVRRARARPAGSSMKSSISDGRRAGGEQIEVAAGVAAAAQAADRFDDRVRRVRSRR